MRKSEENTDPVAQGELKSSITFNVVWMAMVSQDFKTQRSCLILIRCKITIIIHIYSIYKQRCHKDGTSIQLTTSNTNTNLLMMQALERVTFDSPCYKCCTGECGAVTMCSVIQHQYIILDTTYHKQRNTRTKPLLGTALTPKIMEKGAASYCHLRGITLVSVFLLASTNYAQSFSQ